MCVSPNSVFAVSKASSIAQRCPSTRTSVSSGVPAGHQVEKNARSSSAEAAPDQQPARPQAGEVLVVFLRLEIGQLEIGPVIQARSLGADAR